MVLLITAALWLQLLEGSLSDDVNTTLSDDVITALSDDVMTTLSDDGVTRGEGMCVAYGLCQQEDGLPCVSNTPAQPLPDDQTVRDKLIQICPHLE